MYVRSLKSSLISNVFASADIKAFGRTYVPIYKAASYWSCTFLHPGCFYLALRYHKNFSNRNV